MLRVLYANTHILIVHIGSKYPYTYNRMSTTQYSNRKARGYFAQYQALNRTLCMIISKEMS